MKRFVSVIGLLALCYFSAFGQIDDVSEAVGLPIPIGAPVIYGQVAIRNIPKGEKRPTIFVYLRNGGAQIDKYQANDKGYWYFLKTPVNGHTVAFEIDGNEVGQTFLAAGISNRVRQDVEFDWNALKGATRSQTGTINARDRYDRPSATQPKFDSAMAAVREKKNDEAIRLFGEVVKEDPRDFTAWMMIGTVQYSDKKHDEARAAFAKAIELKPDHFLANLNYGRLEMSQKAFDRAVPLLVKAVEIDAGSADANHLLGEAYLQSKKGSLAVGYLNKAIELAPIEKAEIHLRLAALYKGAGLKDRASAEYKAFLSKVKDHPDKAKFEQYIKENPPKQ